MTVAARRLYLTADKQTVVGHNDPAAAFLLCAVGQEIPANAPDIPAHLRDAGEREPEKPETTSVVEKPEGTPAPKPRGPKPKG